MTHIKSIVEFMQVAIQKLEVVGREPNGEVDGAIRNLNNLSKFLVGVPVDAAILKVTRSGVKDTIQLLTTAPDDREQTVAGVMNRLKDLSDFILKVEAELPKPESLTRVAAIQIPPSLRGEPADVLDKPAKREHSAEDQARIAEGLKPFAPPQPTEQELKDREQVVAQNENAIRNERGGRIAASTAKIRGALLDIKGLSKITADAINLELGKLEHQAFLGDGGPVGSGITGPQLDLQARIKALESEARQLRLDVHKYLADEQGRLRAEADRNADEARRSFETGTPLTTSTVETYAAYRAFSEADAYGLLERGAGDVRIGLLAISVAVGGK